MSETRPHKAAPRAGLARAPARTPLFAQLIPVHQVPGRVRYRYGLRAGPAMAAAALEYTLGLCEGITRARVKGQARSLIVHYDPLRLTEPALRHTLLLLEPPAAPPPQPPADEPGLRLVARSGALLLASPWLPRVLRRPATLGTARPLFAQAMEQLTREGLNSHVLEALAVGISAARNDLSAANTTLFMLALGEYLEHSIARRSDALLRGLLRPDIGEVWVQRGEAEICIKASELAVGDTVVVGAGACIPVDGTVMRGEALVNEATMTGESVAVAKARGDRALSGTVVEEGRLCIYAEQVGQETAMARVANYVEHSLASKSQAQLSAARLADRLVPLVLGLAGSTWAVSGDWGRTAAVLQADYACALKLATPVAFKAAMHRAGQSGVLVKGADVLERLAEVDTVVFDKTGTLTTGRLEVTDSISFHPRFTADDVIFLAASVEEHYFHPLALAVVDAARMRNGRHFEHTEVQFIAAHGVASDVNGQRIVVGSRHFVEEDEGVPISGGQRRQLDQLYRAGKTLLYIGYGGVLLGVLALKDHVRANAQETVRQLRRMGIQRILMLSGDHRDRAEEIARQLGLDGFHAELLPQDKAAIIQAMAASGAKIAFVGDGINDAPALAGAHVGIAMQSGADIARLTADMALLEDDIALVAQIREIALRTMARITTNYHLTVGINTSILVAAALGALTPVAASILHNGGTIGILLNALRATGKHRERVRKRKANP